MERIREQKAEDGVAKREKELAKTGRPRQAKEGKEST